MGGDDRSRSWEMLSRLTTEAEALVALDETIIRVRFAAQFAPDNQELRRRLRAIASLPSVREVAVSVLDIEVGKALCDEPAAAAALLEVLVSTLELLDRPV